MTNEQKIISELREFVDKFNVVLHSYGAVCSGFSMKLKLDELEQKYCNKVVETDKRVYACSDCGHPHKLEDLILLDSELEQGKTK